MYVCFRSQQHNYNTQSILHTITTYRKDYVTIQSIYTDNANNIKSNQTKFISLQHSTWHTCVHIYNLDYYIS